MSALHWICALTLALVCCLSAQPVKRNADKKAFSKHDILENFLKSFKDVAKNNCPNDMEIYSPADVHQDCLSSALNCSMNELDVLEYECGLDEKKDDLNVFESFYTELNYAKNDTSPSPSSCKACETYPKKNVEEFLEAIKSLVEQW